MLLKMISWWLDLLKFVDPLVPHSYSFQVWKTTAANFGRHQQPGISITWPSCGKTWGLWALPWPMPARDPREWLEWHWLVFFQGKSLRASFFTPVFLELVCPDIKLLVSLREASCFLVPISSAEVGKRSKPSLTRERIHEHEHTTVGGGKETGWKMSSDDPHQPNLGYLSNKGCLLRFGMIWRLQHRCSSLLNIYMNMGWPTSTFKNCVRLKTHLQGKRVFSPPI